MNLYNHDEIIGTLQTSTIVDNKIFMWAVTYGHLDIVKLLLNAEFESEYDINEAIYTAINNHHIDIAEFLLHTARANIDIYKLLLYASQNNHIDLVKLLLRDARTDPNTRSGYPLQIASSQGHTDIVKLLLQDPRIIPSDDNNLAIRWAIEKDHLDVIRLLLHDSRINLFYDSSIILQQALTNDRSHTHVMKLLLRHKQINPSNWTKEIIQMANSEINQLILLNANVNEYADQFILLICINNRTQFMLPDIIYYLIMLVLQHIWSALNNHSLNDYLISEILIATLINSAF